MPTTLYLVTPCSRPENLPRIRAALDAALGGGPDVLWIVVGDGLAIDPDAIGPRGRALRVDDAPRAVDGKHYGHPLRNAALDLLRRAVRGRRRTRSLVGWLDDDTLPHPRLASLVESWDPRASGFCCAQAWPSGELRLQPTPESPRIDTGCLYPRLDVALRTRWRWGAADDPESWYAADQTYFADLLARAGAAWQWRSEIGSTYNALRG